jgi:3-oxoacyl-ACP reductase-like protein
MRKPLKPFTIERASVPAPARNSKAAPVAPIVADKASPRPADERKRDAWIKGLVATEFQRR